MIGSLDVRQSHACLLRAQVCGRAPEGFFANQPQAVRDLVNEASLAFKALGENEELQHGAAAKASGPESGCDCRCA